MTRQHPNHCQGHGRRQKTTTKRQPDPSPPRRRPPTRVQDKRDTSKSRATPDGDEPKLQYTIRGPGIHPQLHRHACSAATFAERAWDRIYMKENEDPVASSQLTAATDSGNADQAPRYLAPQPTLAGQTAARKLRIYSAPQICWHCRDVRSVGRDRSLGPKRSWGFALCLLCVRTLYF